ncbi:MAG TPA: hypothetical protein VM183_12025 [Burkholderiales bacterium]|nr:hypothetical protein [Burkholderiales bacterium]
MHAFSSLMLRASQTFGAPAYLARALGQSPRDVYRWIAGVEQPAPGERERFEALLRAALAKKAALPATRRRWVDQEQARA